MNNLLKVLAAFFALTLIACGAQKDLEREEERRKEAEEKNSDLNYENEILRNALKNIYVSDGSLWSWAAIKVGYDVAMRICDRMGYTLPTEEEAAEFKAQVLVDHPEWESAGLPSAMHVLDTTKSLIEGTVICRAERKK